jgi:hypothetical protein
MAASSSATGWERASPDGAVSEEREEALDEIDPGRRSRREVHMPARSLGEPVADQLGLVGSVFVHDDVDVEIGRDVALDLVK